MRIEAVIMTFGLAIGALVSVAAPSEAAGDPVKSRGVFFPRALVEVARRNAAQDPWARSVRDGIVQAAEPWRRMSDRALWDLMFGHTISRSWMVWSNGHCPACKQSVPMYTWEIDALGRPWKVRCPHCKEQFPKNDFGKFYASGLDEQGVFDPKRADRSLLFNAEHPAAADPLRSFGVDDGEGFVDGDHRWRFIGAFLIYGQWKQAIVEGARALGAAYVVTGDPIYAHKAGVLLDRVADLYPTFDYLKEAYTYEKHYAAGYVSVWHDACEETRWLVQAYDQVFDGIKRDRPLAQFLAGMASEHRLANTKRTFADVQRNIEDGLLRDPLKNIPKVLSNYPRTEVLKLNILLTLGYALESPDVRQVFDAMLTKATAVDGVTGEKGLAGYTAYTISGLAEFLAQCVRMDPQFVPRILARHPRVRDMYRFHIDTLCLGRYYPQSGDSGTFAATVAGYCAMPFTSNPGIGPSVYSLMWEFARATGDPAFAQTLYASNGHKVDGLPYDLLARDPARFRSDVAALVAKEGPDPVLRSVNKQEWHIAILRSGRGDDARALWLDYDTGGNHCHLDGMNVGLFARGLDLMPDMGYPPVQYGGWDAPRARWYTMSAAHNTVVVDGKSSVTAAGKTTLWADGDAFRAIRVAGPGLIEGKQFERTLAMVDISPRDFYALDVFRVAGGTDHARFLHSHFGAVETRGLALQPAADYGHDTQMRAFRTDAAPQPGWSVDWRVEDRYHYRNPAADVHFRLTDLTADAQASVAEGWIAIGGYNATQEVWIPRVMARRSGTAPLASTFVSVLEPYEGAPALASIRRIALEAVGGQPLGDACAAVEITLADGRRDLLVTVDAENPLGAKPAWSAGIEMQAGDVRTDAELALVRRAPAGAVQRVVICRGRGVACGGLTLRLKQNADFFEATVADGVITVVGGAKSAIESATVDGKAAQVR